MIRPKSPCLGCEERTGNCHSLCELFSLFSTELARYKENVKKVKDSQRNVNDFKYERVASAKRQYDR
ncbi:MAG: hypothetical protein ACI4LO_00235 [Anaerovoracaceae bacterium]